MEDIVKIFSNVTFLDSKPEFALAAASAAYCSKKNQQAAISLSFFLSFFLSFCRFVETSQSCKRFVPNNMFFIIQELKRQMWYHQ